MAKFFRKYSKGLGAVPGALLTVLGAFGILPLTEADALAAAIGGVVSVLGTVVAPRNHYEDEPKPDLVRGF